ncbi:MAG: hypothetical protein FGM54_05555 [Chitinophagaceae bacterium]|nr:hypothetical protein [Chitinophagaceae bacterium]
MKQIFLVGMFLLNTSLVFAQMKQNNMPGNLEQREARREKMESMKIAHIASKLNLEPKTAETFWPMYNQYENEMRAVLQEARAKRQDNSLDVNDMLDKEQKALDIKKKYTAQFSKVLRPEQVSALFQAEKEFRMMLMRKARENKQGDRRQQQGPALRR